ncbi:NADH-quinone oxidoreductase subunit C [Enemella evansiae]|nr:NADH-quinone oxidoreductase subunit C [Enemella evansiae]
MRSPRASRSSSRWMSSSPAARPRRRPSATRSTRCARRPARGCRSMAEVEVRPVPPGEWVSAARAAAATGYAFFDWLDCVDEIGRAEEFRIVLQLLDRGSGASLRLETRVSRDEPVLDSLTEVFGGAAWAERELADLFGVRFTGGDPTSLLIEPRYGGHPLRKDEVLGARAAASWPGAKEPGETGAASRRRMVPPGVPDPEVWGDRDPAAPPPTPDEIAASAQGGRVRRRR